MTDTALLPCPFCGRHSLRSEPVGRLWRIACDDPNWHCGAAIMAHNEMNCQALWNTRTSTPCARKSEESTAPERELSCEQRLNDLADRVTALEKPASTMALPIEDQPAYQLATLRTASKRLEEAFVAFLSKCQRGLFRPLNTRTLDQDIATADAVADVAEALKAYRDVAGK